MENQAFEDQKFKPGQSGNPEGKKKGVKNWATVVQNILGDEELFEAVLKNAPSWVKSLPKRNGANAIVVAMQIKAMGGDHKAAEWLRKTGFGDKLDITNHIEQPILGGQSVHRDLGDQEDPGDEGEDQDSPGGD